MHTLLESWKHWREESPPYVLADDQQLLQSVRSARATVVHTDWRSVIEQQDFCAPGDRRLHLGLLPEPFCGDLSTASIYVLLLNPGLGPTDYYGEFRVPEFREARLLNLRQKFSGDRMPFYMLDPAFSWHGGFAWWHRKFAGVISEVAMRRSISFSAAQQVLARGLASVELVPYHSAGFADADGWLAGLKSVSLARQFVREVVVPRVERRDAIVIATRQVQQWDLPAVPGVIRYSTSQARGAHLSPASPGGSAILRWLDR